MLALLAEGRSDSAVARALSIMEAAVGKHVAGVFVKLEPPVTQDDNRRVPAVLAYLRGAARWCQADLILALAPMWAESGTISMRSCNG